MIIKQRHSALRKEMSRLKLDAYLVPSADPHGSEYVPECWRRREFITGFSGSVGDAVVTKTTAAQWADSRYFLQAERELKGSGVQLMKYGLPGTPTPSEWLRKNFKSGSRVGCDPQTLSHAEFSRMKTALHEWGIDLVSIEKNLIDIIWKQAPSLPDAIAEAYPLKFAGRSIKDKLKDVRAAMRNEGATAHVISALDSIAWLFNIRGNDVPYNPLAISYAIVHEKSSEWFVDRTKVTTEVRKALGSAVRIRDYDSFGAALKKLGGAKSKIWIDPNITSQWIVDGIGAKTLRIHRPSPILLLKACKNTTEIRGSQNAHIRDGVAMVKFLCWLETAVKSGRQTEISIGDQIDKLRSEVKWNRGLSFDSIIGYGPNGAVVHYRAIPETNLKVKPTGMLLTDTGGQYIDGTTDITRTICLSAPTREWKEHYTLVLKGHIAIATAVFPEGTDGAVLEALSRKPLWQNGHQFLHGTGHGVGAYLCVHEGPQSLAPRGHGIPLRPGMIVSNEPGSYVDGKFGVRTENLVYVADDKKRSTTKRKFYRLENLTMCPIDTRAIDKSHMTKDEIAYLNRYHAEVRTRLLPHLNGKEAEWLKRKTKAI